MAASLVRWGALLALTAGLAGCGNSGGGSGPPPQNVLPITIDAGPPGVGAVNEAFVSVTVCAPGSSTACQTIDHVLLDTGSSGLRIVASVLNVSLALPQQTDASGNAVAECEVFADGYSWGSVRLADVRLAGETASSIPIEIIGDPALPAVPATCSSQGPVAEETVQSLGANGILGIGAFVQDCGPACAQLVIPGTYYTCPASGCASIALALERQVQNPVAVLPSDNNGAVIDLPAIPAGGATALSGSLILGIGTQGNNALGSALALDLDTGGNFVTLYGGRTLAAFFDSGSNGLFFTDATIPMCPAGTVGEAFYCPASTQSLTASVKGAANGASESVSFSVANANSLFAASNLVAFNDLAGPFLSGYFDWGLPFFYGRRIFTAIEQRSTPAGSGPYVAF